MNNLPLAEDIAGFRILRGALDENSQREIVSACRAICKAAPLVRPMTGWGKPMSVRMTSAGDCGWVIDRGRYRYTSTHPETGRPWPAIPRPVLGVWDQFADWPERPHCCLINWYGPDARMGLHQDKDEDAFDAPVLSISLGDPARFRIGGSARKDQTTSTILNSGDVVVMGGQARLAYHGIDRIRYGSSRLLPKGGRINLTLRVAR